MFGPVGVQGQPQPAVPRVCPQKGCVQPRQAQGHPCPSHTEASGSGKLDERAQGLISYSKFMKTYKLRSPGVRWAGDPCGSGGHARLPNVPAHTVGLGEPCCPHSDGGGLTGFWLTWEFQVLSGQEGTEEGQARLDSRPQAFMYHSLSPTFKSLQGLVAALATVATCGPITSTLWAPSLPHFTNDAVGSGRPGQPRLPPILDSGPDRRCQSVAQRHPLPLGHRSGFPITSAPL